MNRKRTKRKLKVGRIITAIGIFLGVIAIVIGVMYFVSNNGIGVNKTDMYLASDVPNAEIFVMDDEDKLNTYKDVVRGTKVVSLNREITYEDVSYTEIEFDDGKYYVMSDSLVSDERDVVLEDVKYVRTSVTVYENETDSKIESFIKKGNEIEITDYDKLFDD